MKLKDEVRFFWAKLFLKKTVLFSFQKKWEKSIRKRIEGYVPFFYEFKEVNINRFNMIIPLTLHAQKYLNSNTKSFLKKSYLCPSDYCIELFHDKISFHRFMVNNGFQNFVPKINEEFHYPYIIKKRHGEWGHGISIIADKKSEIKNTDKIDSEEYFTQQYIKDKNDYSAHIIIVNNEIIFFRVLKFTFQAEYFIKGHNGPKADSVEMVDHKKFKSIFEKILISTNYQGICCIDYKVTGNDLKILEINPRFGGSLTRFINKVLNEYSRHLPPTLNNPEYTKK